MKNSKKKKNKASGKSSGWESYDRFVGKKHHDELLEACLKDPSAMKDFQIRLKGPDVGWIDFFLDRDGQEHLFFTASDAYDPFPEIREWLEAICKEPDNEHRILVNDESLYHMFLYVPAISDDGRPALILDEQSDGTSHETLFAVADTRIIVSEFYNAIMTLSRESVRDLPPGTRWWRMDNDHDSDEFDYDIFHSLVRSETIEKYLAENFFQTF